MCPTLKTARQFRPGPSMDCQTCFITTPYFSLHRKERAGTQKLLSTPGRKENRGGEKGTY